MKRIGDYINPNKDTEFRTLMSAGRNEKDNNEVLKSTIESQLNDIKGPLSKFLRLKTKCTYYRLDLSNSFHLHGSSDFFSAHNKDLKNCFDKINNFIVIIESSDGQYEYNDESLENEGEITSTIKILPNTIEPHPGDMIVMKYLKIDSLWRVLEAKPIGTEEDLIYELNIEIKERNYNSKSFFKKRLEEAVTKEYYFKFEHYGTKFKTIVSDEEINYLDTFKEFYKSLAKYYDDMFFDNYTSTYVCNSNNKYIIDEMLNIFLINTETMMVNDNVKIPTIFYTFENKDFEKTIYSSIIKKDKLILKNNKCSLIDKNEIALGDSTLLIDKSIVWYSDKNIDDEFKQFDDELLSIFTNNTNNSIRDSDLIENYNFEKLIIYSLNSYMDSNDQEMILEIKEFYNILNKFKIKPYGMILEQNTLKMFYYIPLLLYVIKNYLNIILSIDF